MTLVRTGVVSGTTAVQRRHGESRTFRSGPAVGETSERLRVVHGSVSGRPILRRGKLEGGVGPLFFSYGDLALLCGQCNFILIEGAPSLGILRDAIVKCPDCDAMNES